MLRGNGRSRSGHASKFEDTIIQDLKDRGIAHDYEPVTFTYERKVHRAHCRVCGCSDVVVLRKYTPDIALANTYIEAKGKFTAENRSKMEDFLRGHPEVDLRFLFMRDNWLTNKHKTKYSDWAKKLGIKYAIGTSVPQEWVDAEVSSTGV